MTDEENNIKTHPEFGNYVSEGPMPEGWGESTLFEEIIIDYDGYEIHIREDCIMRVSQTKNHINYNKILNCPFTILKKCIHNKVTRYSYELNGNMFHTSTHSEIISRAEPYLRGGLKGRDCMKEVIDYYDKKVPNTKAREFLGFDNGWILPQTEDEKDISIIVITDYQQDAYDRSRKILKDYSDKKKNEIRTLMKSFIGQTSCETINGAILIGWSIASLFRLYFIRKHDLFPILYNYGDPNTGRSSLEDFWIVHFYGVYDTHLPASTSIARLEDHLSKSTFPHSFQDIKESSLRSKPELIPILQDYSTSIGLFERKKNSKEVDFSKFKIAALNLDSNDILKIFSSPAINERQIFVNYRIKTEYSPEWTLLREKLRKYKLFSLVYDYTKDWNDEKVDELYIEFLNEFVIKYNANSSRLIKSAAMIKFGLEIFKKTFGIVFKVNGKEISDKNLINTIINGSSQMTEHIVDQFRGFCALSINYNETTKVITEHPNGEIKTRNQKGTNPHYLNHALRLSHDGTYYAYVYENHQDFISRYERIGMKELADKLKKGLSSDEEKYIEYGRPRPFKVEGCLGKQMATIKIYPGFLHDTNEIEVERMNYDDLIGD